MKWKERPLGMRIIIILLFIVLISELKNILINFSKPILTFGMYIQYPISSIINLVYIVTFSFVIIGIYNQKFWKLILGLQGVYIISTIIDSIVILLMSPTEFISKFHDRLLDITPVIINNIKSITIILLFISIIIELIIFIYIYKKKEYFIKNK
jgi:hypothetical protein